MTTLARPLTRRHFLANATLAPLGLPAHAETFSGRFKMIRIRQVLYVTGFTLLFQVWTVAAQPLESMPAFAASEKKPFVAAIKGFAGNAKTFYYSFTHPANKDKALVSRRILDGPRPVPCA